MLITFYETEQTFSIYIVILMSLKSNAVNNLMELGFGRRQVVRALIMARSVEDEAYLLLSESSEDKSKVISDDFVSSEDEDALRNFEMWHNADMEEERLEYHNKKTKERRQEHEALQKRMELSTARNMWQKLENNCALIITFCDTKSIVLLSEAIHASRFTPRLRETLSGITVPTFRNLKASSSNNFALLRFAVRNEIDLVAHGFTLEIKDLRGPVPESEHLRWLLKELHFDIALLLIDQWNAKMGSIDFTNCDINGLSPLMSACWSGSLDVVRALLLGDGSSHVNECSKNGKTALHMAATMGSLPIVRALLDAGANAEAADSDGFRPLHEAASAGNVQVVELLIGMSKGVDIRAKTTNKKRRESAYDFAVRGFGPGCKRCAEILGRHEQMLLERDQVLAGPGLSEEELKEKERESLARLAAFQEKKRMEDYAQKASKMMTHKERAMALMRQKPDYELEQLAMELDIEPQMTIPELRANGMLDKLSEDILEALKTHKVGRTYEYSDDENEYEYDESSSSDSD
jgi:hypothetical protein